MQIAPLPSPTKGGGVGGGSDSIATKVTPARQQVLAGPKGSVEDYLKRMYDPGQLPDNNSIGIWGDSGHGKTSLLRTMPGRGLIIDVPEIEGGDVVLKGVAPRIKTVRIHEWDEIDEWFWFLHDLNEKLEKLKEVPERDDDPRWEKARFQWVAFDTITAMSELARRKAKRLEESNRVGLDKVNLSKDSWDDFRAIGNLCSEIIFRFRTIRSVKWIIWLAQKKKTGGFEKGQTETWGPDVTPMTYGALKPSLMLQGHYYIEHTPQGPDRRLRIAPHKNFECKYRVDDPTKHVPPVIRNVDLGNLLMYLYRNGPMPEEVMGEVYQGKVDFD